VSSSQLEIQPLSAALGAEVSGVDLGAPIGDNLLASIRAALLDHQVLFFRDQNMTPADQVRFARQFGDIHHHPYIAGLPEQPEIIEIIKTETDTKNFGGTWHSDQMFTRNPAMGTMLYAKETPDAGGDTLFASMYSAYDGLSDGMREMLERMRTYNAGDKFKHQSGKTREETMAGKSSMALKAPDPDQDTEAEHPTIRTHPETGRKGLYVGAHTQRFAGLTSEESDGLLEYLQAHSTKAEYTCRFRWEPGSVAFWDNRCTQHLAVNDYPGQRRRMHRITICGDEPN
jgi:taurine dioxygenase